MRAGLKLAYEAVAQGIRSLRNDGFVEDEVPQKDRPVVRDVLGMLAADTWRKAGVRTCRVCGCTEDDPCRGGCSWAAPGLCSTCDYSPKQRNRARPPPSSEKQRGDKK